MKKIFLNGFLTFLFTILFSSSVLAQNKEMVSLPLYIAQEDLEIVDEITIEKDVIVISNDLTMKTNVEGDAYVAGGKLEIDGNINGNLTIAGGVVTIRGKVAKNLIVAGGQVMVAETAEIGGYVLGAGTKIDLQGKFFGPVKLWAQVLNVGKEATIAGNLEANVVEKEISPDSKIVGETIIKVWEKEDREAKFAEAKNKKNQGMILSFLNKIVILFFLVKFFGDKVKTSEIKNRIMSILKSGFLLQISVPFLFLILIATIIGGNLGAIILNAYILALCLSGVVVSMVLGKYMAEKNKLKINLFLQASFVLLLITVIELVPTIGWISKILVSMFGLGIIYKSGKAFLLKK